jgi:hypothetical protein
MCFIPIPTWASWIIETSLAPSPIAAVMGLEENPFTTFTTYTEFILNKNESLSFKWVGGYILQLFEWETCDNKQPYYNGCKLQIKVVYALWENEQEIHHRRRSQSFEWVHPICVVYYFFFFTRRNVTRSKGSSKKKTFEYLSLHNVSWHSAGEVCAVSVNNCIPLLKCPQE